MRQHVRQQKLRIRAKPSCMSQFLPHFPEEAHLCYQCKCPVSALFSLVFYSSRVETLLECQCMGEIVVPECEVPMCVAGLCVEMRLFWTSISAV